MGIDMYVDWEIDLEDGPCFCARNLAAEFGMGLSDLLREKGCTFLDNVTCPEDEEYDEEMYDSYEEYKEEGHLPIDPIYIDPDEFEKEYENAIQIIQDADESVFIHDKEGLLEDLKDLRVVIEFAKEKKSKIGLSIC